MPEISETPIIGPFLTVDRVNRQDILRDEGARRSSRQELNEAGMRNVKPAV